MQAYVLCEARRVDGVKTEEVVGVFYTYAAAEQELNRRLLPVFQQQDIEQGFTIEEFEMKM